MNFEKGISVWCPLLASRLQGDSWAVDLGFLESAGVEATPFTTPIVGEFLLSRSAYTAALQADNSSGMRLASERLVCAALAVDELMQSRRVAGLTRTRRAGVDGALPGAHEILPPEEE